MPSNPNNPGSNRSTTGTAGSSPGAATAGGTTSGSASTGAAAGPRDTADSSLKDSARSIKDQAATKAREAGGQVKEQAREKLDEAKTQAMSKLRDGKSRVAGQVGTMAHAFRSAGNEFRSEDQARLAEFTDSAAERIERVGRYLDEHSLGELLDDVERVARRAPTLFLGGAFAMGLLGARFLKTSERRRLHDRDDQFSTTGASYGAGSRTLPRPGELSTSSYGDSYIPASTQPGSAGLGNEPGFTTPPGTGGTNG